MLWNEKSLALFSLDCFIDAIFLHLMTKCFALTLIFFLSPSPSRFQLLFKTGNHPLCAPTSMFNVPFCDKPIYSFIHEIVIVSIDHALERFESTWKYYLYCGRHCRETPISMNQREKKNKRRTFQFEIYRLSYTYQTAGIKAKHVWNISIRCIIYSAQTISCRFYRLNSLTVELK